MNIPEEAKNIEDYDTGLKTSADNVGILRDELGEVRHDVQFIERVIGRVEAFRNEVKAFGDDIGKLQLIFNLMGKAGALKAIANVGSQMLKRVETVIDKIDDKLEALVVKIESSGVRNQLQTVDNNLGKVDDGLGSVEDELNAQKEAFGAVLEIAAKLHAFTPDPIDVTDALVEVPAAALGEINQAFDDARDLVGDFGGGAAPGDFSAFSKFEAEMDKIISLLDGVRSPLNSVYQVLKPIEPLLAAVNFVASLTVDPVINFIKKTLGVDRLINAAADKILALLPDVNVLDDFDVALDDVLDVLGQFDFNTAGNHDIDGNANTGVEGHLDRPDDKGKEADPFGIGDWIFDELQGRLLETAGDKIGSISAGGGIAIKIPQGVRGHDPDDPNLVAEVPGLGNNVGDLIMIGDARDNTITAREGSNLLYGAEGDDRLEGGSGEDTAVFTSDVGQYRFHKLDETSEVVIEHRSPIKGVSLDGRDTLDANIEKVSFLGGSSGSVQTLTISELLENVRTEEAGEDIEFIDDDPNAPDPDLFYFSSNIKGPNFDPDVGTVLSGGGGDDTLAGSSFKDQLLGLGGNDDLRTGGGIDSIDGGEGEDTLSIYQLSETTIGYLVDLAAQIYREIDATPPEPPEEPESSSVQNVENVYVNAGLGGEIGGNFGANELTGSDFDDVIDGREGDDQLFGRAGDDILIGNIGKDEVFGGVGDDTLVAGALPVAGVSDFYDGGEGEDTLSYSSESGIGNDPSAETAPVRIFAGEGRVEHLGATGTGDTIVTEDTFVSIENFIGSFREDELFGGLNEGEGLNAVSIDGGFGDDVLHAEYTTESVRGGAGADRIIAHATRGEVRGRIETTYDGGAGFDTLDLSADANLRWEVFETGGHSSLDFFAATDKQPLASPALFDTLLGFEDYIGSANDDRIVLLRDKAQTVDSGDGDDFVRIEHGSGGTSDVETGAGEDRLELSTARGNETASIIADAGEGNDEIHVRGTIKSTGGTITVDAGAGNDIVFFRQGRNSVLDGGEDLDENGDPILDNDILSSHFIGDENFEGSATNLNPLGGLEVDLVAGTLAIIDRSEANGTTVENFETVIGSNNGDRLGGSAEGDTLIGAGGSDILRGRAGGSGDRTFYTIDDPSVPDFDGSWTLEAVVQTNVDNGSFHRIVTKPAGGAQVFSLAVHNGKAHVRFDRPGGFHELEAGFVADGQPHRLAGRYDESAGTLTLFVDGAQLGQLTNVAQPRTSPTKEISIGQFSQDIKSQPFLGEIQEVRVWDSARTNTQLAQDFDAISDPAAETDLALSVVVDEIERANGDEAPPVDESANAFEITTTDSFSGDDLLFGGNGTDSLYGGDGDDFLHGGAAADYIDGGIGSDTASYSLAAPDGNRGALERTDHNRHGVFVDLAQGTARGNTNNGAGSGDSVDTLVSIENIIGSEQKDEIFGDSGDNNLDGGQGDDLIDGRGGNDQISLFGDDVASGGAGDDVFILRAGNATIDGGEGNDTLVFDPTATVLYDPVLGIYISDAPVDFAVWSSDFGDSLAGSTEARTINGVTFTAQEVLEADPTFSNDFGDFFREIPDEAGFEVLLSQSNSERFEGSFTSIENFEGGTQVDLSADDFIAAGAFGVESVIGLSGDDKLFGLGGDDTLKGSIDIDALVLNPDGSSNQKAKLANFGFPSNNNFTVELLFRSTAPSPASGATFMFAEASFSDRILIGVSGGKLRAIANDATLLTDTPSSAIYDGTPHRLSVTFQFGQLTMFLDGEEIGTTFASTSLSGNRTLTFEQEQQIADIRIWDHVRSDEEIARDALIEIEDPQSADGLVANWRPDPANTTEVVDATGGASLTLSGSGAPLPGFTNFADNGDDELEGGAGADMLDGGDGEDAATYRTAKSGVEADLLDAARNDGDAAGDEFVSIEGLIGSVDGDVLRGDSSANTLEGGDGRDLLFGREGDDTLEGGAGNDLLSGWDGDDALDGGEGDDLLIAGAGDDSVEGGDGFDIARFSGARGEYTVTETGGVFTLTSAADGIDAVSGVEQFEFTDTKLAANELVPAQSAGLPIIVTRAIVFGDNIDDMTSQQTHISGGFEDVRLTTTLAEDGARTTVVEDMDTTEIWETQTSRYADDGTFIDSLEFLRDGSTVTQNTDDDVFVF